MQKKVALYARVSTDDQSTLMQLEELRRYVSARGYKLYREYTDNGVSGARESRPALDELMGDARRRRFDVVLVYRFDRFARTLKQLVLALEEFRSLNVDFVSLHESIDTSTPTGRVLFAVIAAFSEFERETLKQRVLSGMESARKRGAKIGRPREVDDKLTARIRTLRKGGSSYREITKETGASAGTISRALAAPKGPPQADDKGE